MKKLISTVGQMRAYLDNYADSVNLVCWTRFLNAKGECVDSELADICTQETSPPFSDMLDICVDIPAHN